MKSGPKQHPRVGISEDPVKLPEFPPPRIQTRKKPVRRTTLKAQKVAKKAGLRRSFGDCARGLGDFGHFEPCAQSLIDH